MTVLAAEAGSGAVEAEGAQASSAGRTMTATPRTGGRTQQGQVGTPPGTKPAARTAVKTTSVPRKIVSKTPQGRIASKAVPRTGGRTQQGARAKPRTGGRTQQGTMGSRRVSTAGPPKNQARQQSTTERRVKARGRQAASTGAKKLTGNYHGAVFGEWLAAVLLIAALPFARPNKTGVSPYSGKDMVQLLAITVVYLILAILAVPGKTSARFAAWFGALLLLAIGLAETANIASAVSQWLNPGAQAAATTAAPKANPSTVNPGSTAPAAATSTGISRNVAQNPGNGLS